MRTTREMAQAEAVRAGIDPALFMNLVNQESRWNPQATSPVGAYGLTQAMPATWAQPGFNVPAGGNRDDPQEQLRFGADYYAAMANRYPGDQDRALAAYNWGAGNADDWNGDPATLPEETRNYVDIVGSGTNLSGGGGNDAMSGGGLGDTIMSPQDQSGMIGAPEEEAQGTEFHPGMLLQGLGAAIAAGARGESSAPDLAVIRKNYFAQQNLEQEKALEAKQQAAGRELFRDNPEMLAFLDGGGDLGVAMQIRNQQEQFDQQFAMQSSAQQFTASQGVLNRAHESEQFNTLSANQRANLSLASEKIDNQVAQFGQSFGLDSQMWDDKVGQLAIDHAFKVAQFDQDTTAGRAASDLANLKFQEQLRAAAFSEGVQTDAVTEARRLSDQGYNEGVRQFEATHGTTMDKLELERVRVANQVSQFAESLGVDNDQFAATITQQSMDHALRVAQFNVSTAEGVQNAELADLKFQEELRQNLITNGLDEGRANQLQADFDENVRQFDATHELKYADLVQSREIADVSAMNASQTTEMKNAIFMSDPNISDSVKLAFQQNQNAQRNVSTAADKANADARGLALRRDGEELSNQAANVTKNRQIQEVLTEYETILAQNPGIDMGRLNEALLPYEKLLNNVGVSFEGGNARERIAALHASVFPGLKPSGAGSTSDWEGTVYAMAFPGVGNNPETFAEQTRYHAMRLQRESAYADYLNANYTGQNGQKLSEVKANWQAKVNNGDADTNPLHVNLDTFDPSNVNGLQVGQVVLINGSARPLTQNMINAYEQNR